VGEGEKRRCDPFDLGLNDWKYSGDFPMLFEADAATLAKLDVREFEIGKQTRTLATNWQLYDHLQKPCVKKHVDQQEQKKAERAGRDRRGPSRTLSAEEKKRKARQATENHTKRLAWWRTKLLRRACIAAIDAGLDSGLRLVLAFAADSRTPNGGLSMAEALEEVRATDSKPGDYRRNEWRANYWACVAAIDGQPKTQHDDEGFVVAELAKRLLAHESKDWRQPTVLPALVEGYSAALGINVAQEWGKLQLPGDGRQLLEELFRLHQTDPLWNLGAEMGQPLARHFTRKQIIKELMAKLDFGSRLKAPKFLKPLAAKATKSTTSTKRKR